MWVAATELAKGDVFVHRAVTLTALDDARIGSEPHGGPRVEVWCERGTDSKRGWVYFGPAFSLEVDRAP